MIQEGSVTFTVDGEEIEAGPGTIVVVPPGAVHSFKGSSDERTRQVNIHPVPVMETTWLDERLVSPSRSAGRAPQRASRAGPAVSSARPR